MHFTDWLKKAWQDFLVWFGVEEQKLASFLYPIFQDAKPLIAKDILPLLINLIPVVVAALTNGYSEALAVAEANILPLLKADGIELKQATLSALAHGLVAQAQHAVDTNASLPSLEAPTINGSTDTSKAV